MKNRAFESCLKLAENISIKMIIVFGIQNNTLLFIPDLYKN